MTEQARETIRVLVTALLSIGILAIAFYDVSVQGQRDSVFLPMAAIVVGYWFGARAASGSIPGLSSEGGTAASKVGVL